MGVTRFPNGVEVGDSTSVATFSLGGTAVTSTAAELNKAAGAAGGYFTTYGTAGKKIAVGTVVVGAGAGGTAFASGLTSVDFVKASVYGDAGAGDGFSNVAAKATGGSVSIFGICAAGTVSTSAGTATWWAIGA